MEPQTALVLVAKPAVREDIRRIAAAADLHLDEREVMVGRHEWGRAAYVIVDAEWAQRCLRERLPRRGGVFIVCAGEPGLAQWHAAAALGADHVYDLPDAESVLVGALAQRSEKHSGDGAVVAVVGGRGGAGASTFAAALALTGARARPTVLVDGDGRGGGIDLLLGIEDKPGLRWPAIVLEGGRISASALHAALPSVQDIAVLACGRGPQATTPNRAAVDAVIEACCAAGDLVVCDVPRTGGADADAFLAAADLVVVVAPAELRACASTESVAVYARARNPNQGLVVRGPAPGGLAAKDVADAVGLPLLASMRPEPRLAHRLERGGLTLTARGPLRRAATNVLVTLYQRPATARWAA